jgi:hypothetical protein
MMKAFILPPGIFLSLVQGPVRCLDAAAVVTNQKIETSQPRLSATDLA